MCIRDRYKTYDSAKTFTYANITQPNRNRLLWLDPSVDGLKTGHTDAAGYCIVATARRPNGKDQRRLITVVVGTASDKLRTQESRALLEWGFQGFNLSLIHISHHGARSPARVIAQGQHGLFDGGRGHGGVDHGEGAARAPLAIGVVYPAGGREDQEAAGAAFTVGCRRRRRAGPGGSFLPRGRIAGPGRTAP